MSHKIVRAVSDIAGVAACTSKTKVLHSLFNKMEKDLQQTVVKPVFIGVILNSYAQVRYIFVTVCHIEHKSPCHIVDHILLSVGAVEPPLGAQEGKH